MIAIPRAARALVLCLAALGCAAPAHQGTRTGPEPEPAQTAPRPRPPVASIRAGTSGNYPPFSSWKGDHAEDFAPALLGAFAEAQGFAISWTRFRWPDLVGDLRAGRFDLAADGITIRPERSVAGRFTLPVARGGAVLLLRRPAWAPPAAGIAPGRAGALAAVHALDRPELRVAVNRGGHLERVARGLLVRARIEAIPDNPAVREALARGDADAVLTNTFEAPRWADGLAGVEAIGPLTHDTVALFLRADQEDLAVRLDTWLLAAEESGALARLRARWLGPGGGEVTATPLDALLAATAERLALMPLVAAAKQRTGKAVEDPGQEARVIAAARATVRKAAAALGVAPPPDARVDAFFQAQMEAARAVQQRTPNDPGAPAFSLEDDLRPAIARITTRMAFLLVRLPHGLAAASVLAKAREELEESGLSPGEIDRLAAPLAALGGT